ARAWRLWRRDPLTGRETRAGGLPAPPGPATGEAAGGGRGVAAGEFPSCTPGLDLPLPLVETGRLEHLSQPLHVQPVSARRAQRQQGDTLDDCNRTVLQLLIPVHLLDVPVHTHRGIPI